MRAITDTTNFRAFSLAIRCFVVAGFLPILALTTSARAGDSIDAERIATGFSNPLYVCAPPGDTSRLFVAEQHGKIKIINLRSRTVNSTPFLDISFEVGQGQGTGILGMTFDPNYAVNGHFYVSYTIDGGGFWNNGISHIARFTVSANPNFTDPATEVTVITADQPQPDHDFDWIGFSNRPGDEGNLYICSGDGGNTNDAGQGHIEPGGNALSTQTLLGKILRIHIENNGTYTIPPNNPFAGQPPPVKQEIFTLGLRNPFRASFDPRNGDMLIGDVGEFNREEVDVQSHLNPGGGENYGWRVREGLIQNPAYPSATPPPGAVDPIIDYAHDTTGVCVIGGYMYHGSRVRALRGLYVFGDAFGQDEFVGRVWTLRYRRGVVSDFQDITSQLFPTRVGGFTLKALTSLGEDANGEIYLVDTDLSGGSTGSVYKIVPVR